jgi:hypothetical protein
MRFYGKGYVWDKDSNSILCRFPKGANIHDEGILETDDERICKKLIELGYRHEGELPKKVEKKVK